MGSANILAPPLPSLATGLPRQGGGEAAQLWCWRENGYQGQRPKKPYKQQHAQRTCHMPIPATHTHTHTGPFLQALCRPTPSAFWVYTLLSILPKFVPQTLVLPTGKELHPDATRVCFAHSNPSASKRRQGNGSSGHYPFIHILTTPARDKSDGKISTSHSE